MSRPVLEHPYLIFGEFGVVAEKQILTVRLGSLRMVLVCPGSQVLHQPLSFRRFLLSLLAPGFPPLLSSCRLLSVPLPPIARIVVQKTSLPLPPGMVSVHVLETVTLG